MSVIDARVSYVIKAINAKKSCSCRSAEIVDLLETSLHIVPPSAEEPQHHPSSASVKPEPFFHAFEDSPILSGSRKQSPAQNLGAMDGNADVEQGLMVYEDVPLEVSRPVREGGKVAPHLSGEGGAVGGVKRRRGLSERVTEGSGSDGRVGSDGRAGGIPREMNPGENPPIERLAGSGSEARELAKMSAVECTDDDEDAPVFSAQKQAGGSLREFKQNAFAESMHVQSSVRFHQSSAVEIHQSLFASLNVAFSFNNFKAKS